MAHIIVAQLTDAQFDSLSQTSVTFREIPAAFIDRLQAVAPSLRVDEIMEKAVRKFLGEAEARIYAQSVMSSAEADVRAHTAALNEELGL